MSENIIFGKLVTGEMVLGEKDDENNNIKNICLVQVMPTQSGSMQIAIVPYGFPFEEEVRGEISMNNVLFQFKEVPTDLTDKYVETKSNIMRASNMGGLGGNPQGGQGGQGGSGLIL
ncbi:MAG: hypothetical protein C0602_00930 [Denitrovibrio sp.]|nr:MAG: hypothetical protein C0602_00930 [Denitrovibrio sp.]